MPDAGMIGWDVGGAHLKAARLDADGGVEAVIQVACPLWQGMDRLDAALDEVGRALGPHTRHAVTMTGEMVDLFPDRTTGVSRLIGTLAQRLPDAGLAFYAGDAGFLDAGAARQAPLALASANWRASAALVAVRCVSALFLDIGSTTTDLTAVHGGRVRAVGHDDATRLVAGELVYTGAVRTPLMALAEQAPFAGEWVPLMAENFATTADLYRVLGRLPEGADQHPTADGGEKTPAASARRLARMLGRDVEMASLSDWQRLAGWLAEVQVRRIADACARLWSGSRLDDDAPIVTAGVGRFLVPEIAARAGRRLVDFSELVPCDASAAGRVSDCAPAIAVAWLALQRHR